MLSSSHLFLSNWHITRITTQCLSTAARVKAFPILPDPLNVKCLQLDQAKNVAEEHLAQLHKLTKISMAGGGEKSIAIHTQKNKKIVIRERVARVFDESSDTLELGTLSGLGLEYGDMPGASVMTIIGKVHGTYCIIIGSDATFKGGSYSPISVAKVYRAQEISEAIRLPAINLVDSGGGFLPLQSGLFPDKKHGGRSFYNEAYHGSIGIPQLSIVNGSCTAGGAYAPSMCEENIMVDKIATLFLAGPPLVMSSTGERVTAEELGGARLHTEQSGVSDYFAHDEQESFEMLQDTFATLNISPDTEVHQYDDPLYSAADLDALSGLPELDKDKMYAIILRLADGSKFREYKKRYGTNLITGYCCIGGSVVGVVANYGPITSKDGLKGAHFIQVCQHRDLPVIFLQNSGSLDSIKEFNESLSGKDLGITLKSRSAMAASIACSSIHKISFNIGGCHGDDNHTMCGPSFSPRFMYAWPAASTFYQPNSVAYNLFLPHDETGKAKKPKSLSKFNFPVYSSWYMASRNLVDNIIIPSKTRETIIQCLKICKQQERLHYKPKKFPVFRF